MKTSLLISFSAMLATTLAAPTSSRIQLAAADLPSWSVTNYTEGCSPGGCIYHFTICSPPPSTTPSPFHEPAFHTTCSGTTVQNELVACSNPNISTNSVPGVSNVTIVVQHTWREELGNPPGSGGVGTFWVQGNHTLVDPVVQPAAFEVPQLEAWAIA